MSALQSDPKVRGTYKEFLQNNILVMDSILGCCLFCPFHFLKIIGFIPQSRFHGTDQVAPPNGKALRWLTEVSHEAPMGQAGARALGRP